MSPACAELPAPHSGADSPCALLLLDWAEFLLPSETSSRNDMPGADLRALTHATASSASPTASCGHYRHPYSTSSPSSPPANAPSKSMLCQHSIPSMLETWRHLGTGQRCCCRRPAVRQRSPRPAAAGVSRDPCAPLLGGAPYIDGGDNCIEGMSGDEDGSIPNQEYLVSKQDLVFVSELNSIQQINLTSKRWL